MKDSGRQKDRQRWERKEWASLVEKHPRRVKASPRGRFQSILCPSVIIFPFFAFSFSSFLSFFWSLSLFLGTSYIFKGIIYKAFCLLNVFLFVMQFFISTCCDVPQLDFFFKNDM